jgi:hypothetical protein
MYFYIWCHRRTGPTVASGGQTVTTKPSFHFIKLCALTLILGCGPLGSDDEVAEDLLLAAPGTGGTGGMGTPKYMNKIPVVQSSTAFGGIADRASDLFTNGEYAAGSVSHTDFEALPFWQTATRPENPASVTVWNRTDCCQDRLGTFEIWFWRDRFQSWIKAGPFDMASRTRFDYVVPADNNWGAVDYVRIQKVSAGYLSLAEVVVMAR